MCSVMSRSPIATYNITGIAERIASIGEKRLGQPNITLVFINDMNGIVSLKEAFMKVRYQYQEEVEVEKPKNVMKSSEQGEEANKETSEDAAAKQTETEKEAQNSTETEADIESEGDKTYAEEPSNETVNETPSEPSNETVDETPSETLSEPSNETTSETTGKPSEGKEPKKDIVLVTKRKIRKIPLHVTSLLDRLVILPMTNEERQRSMAL